VRSNERVVHLVVVTQLDFNPLAEWRKHFGKDDLLIPDGRVAVFLHARFALWWKREHKEIYITVREYLLR
jgi:hypothetical protein